VRPTSSGTWRGPWIETDPFDVAIEDKVAMLLEANEAALKVVDPNNQRRGFVNSSMFFLRE
jgi:TldD protein